MRGHLSQIDKKWIELTYSLATFSDRYGWIIQSVPMKCQKDDGYEFMTICLHIIV